MSSNKHFTMGVNYWPADSAMSMWARFDAASIARDFWRVAAAGLESVRLFLRWEEFQPEPRSVDRTSLSNLESVADMAASQGLRVIPTLFTGHMSGANWFPAWMTQDASQPARFPSVVSGMAVPRRQTRDWWNEREVRESMQLWAREASATLAGHPALWAWDLGNENSNCWVPRSRDDARQWLETMTSAIRESDPDALITVGLHMEDLEEDRMIRPREAAEYCDFLCMHGYPIYSAWARGYDDPWLCPFLSVLTQWLGNKLVLFEEYGAPTRSQDDPQTDASTSAGEIIVLDEQPAATYTVEVTKNLRRVGATGGLLWCYADYVPSLWTEPPFSWALHERHFGLWRHDGSAKPAVEQLTALRPALDDIAVDLTSTAWIDITPDEFYDVPRQQISRLYQRFLASVHKEVQSQESAL